MQTRRLLASPMLVTLHERLRERFADAAPPTASDLQQMLTAQTEPERNVIVLTATGEDRDQRFTLLEGGIGLYIAE